MTTTPIVIVHDDPLAISDSVESYRIDSIRIYSQELRQQCSYLQDMIPWLQFDIPPTQNPCFLRCRKSSHCWIEVIIEKCTHNQSKRFKKYVIHWTRGVLGFLEVHCYGFHTWLRHKIDHQQYVRKRIFEYVSLAAFSLLPLPIQLWQEILEFL